MSVLVNDGMIYPVVGKYAANCRIGRVYFAADIATCPLAVPTSVVAALVSSGPCGEFGGIYRCVSPESIIPVCCCGRIFSFSSYSVGIFVWVGLQLKVSSYIKVSLLGGLCTTIFAVPHCHLSSLNFTPFSSMSCLAQPFLSVILRGSN